MLSVGPQFSEKVRGLGGPYLDLPEQAWFSAVAEQVERRALRRSWP